MLNYTAILQLIKLKMKALVLKKSQNGNQISPKKMDLTVPEIIITMKKSKEKIMMSWHIKNHHLKCLWKILAVT